MVTLAFAKTYEYDTAKSGITVPAKLSVGALAIDLKAKLDLGSTFCIFARSVGEQLGLDIESGVMERISTVTGSFVAYGHEVRLTVLEFDFDTSVYFAADPHFQRNFIGRQGFFDRSRVGVVDYDGKLYLSDYNDPTE